MKFGDREMYIERGGTPPLNIHLCCPVIIVVQLCPAPGQHRHHWSAEDLWQRASQ